jgi:hypothetical protein
MRRPGSRYRVASCKGNHEQHDRQGDKWADDGQSTFQVPPEGGPCTICNHSISPEDRGLRHNIGTSAVAKPRPSKLSCYSWRGFKEPGDEARLQVIGLSIIAAVSYAVRVSFLSVAARVDAAPVAMAIRNQDAENQYDRRATTMAATAPKAAAVGSTRTENPWNMSQCTAQ